MTIAILTHLDDHCSIVRSTLRRRAQRTLAALNLSDHTLSILLCNDAYIQQLNATYRHINHATDVLAFPTTDFTIKPRSTKRLPGRNAQRTRTHFEPVNLESELGDVVISLDTAHRQALRYRHALIDEVTFLMVHGVLHLVGCDHDSQDNERRMRARTDLLLSSLGKRLCDVRQAGRWCPDV